MLQYLLPERWIAELEKVLVVMYISHKKFKIFFKKAKYAPIALSYIYFISKGNMSLKYRKLDTAV